MTPQPSDYELVEKANLSRNFTLAAHTTIAALHSLRALSKELGIPMEQITREQIIAAISLENAASQKFAKHG